MLYILTAIALIPLLIKSRGALLFIILFLISFVLGFRVEANADYLNYYEYWSVASQASLSTLLIPGPLTLFLLINKLFSYVGLSFEFFSFFVTFFASISAYLVFRLTHYKSSFYVTLPSLVFVLSSTQLRQSLALSFFILGLFLLDKLKVKSLYLPVSVIVFLCSLLHFSMLLFLLVASFVWAPLDFVVRLKVRLRSFLLISFPRKLSPNIFSLLMLIFLILFYSLPIAQSRLLYYQDHLVAVSTSGTLLRLIPLNLILFLSFFSTSRPLLSTSKVSNILIGSVFLLLLLNVFFFVSPITADRLTWYIYPGLCFYLFTSRFGNIFSFSIFSLLILNILIGPTFESARQSGHLFLKL